MGVSIAIIGFRQIETIVPNLSNELLWSRYTENQLVSFNLHLGLLPTLVAVFALTSLPFILIGQKMARLMRQFPPLTAYGLDILGALMGIGAFSLLSFASGALGSPLAWFLVSGSLSLWLIREHQQFLLVGAVCVVAAVIIIYAVSRNEIWSPYYSVKVADAAADHSIRLYVNNFFFQKAVDFRSDSEARKKYEFPYLLKSPQSVLILGAGTGNDVAMAGLRGVPDIDAVELDPVIADIGRQRHPNRPYQNPNVHLFIDDARSFLKKSDKQYDMIVLGTLDSHALLSARSTVRLDNFVYTTEALESIQEHLNPDGIVVLMFSVPEPWLRDKIIKSVQRVFPEPEPTIQIAKNAYLFNLMILAGPGLTDIRRQYPVEIAPTEPIPESVFSTRNLSTDDWPYLYLREHAIPRYYLEAIGLLLALALYAIVFLYRKNIIALPDWSGLNFFCLGAAFLLLETKSITTLSLLYGSTWFVNAFVFGGILTMVLLANIVVTRVPIRRIETVYLLLGLSLALNYFLPVSMFLGLEFWLRSGLSALVVALPIFFASIIFSTHFRSVTSLSVLYGLNLMGAVVGGFLEYSSMLFGLSALYILAGILYALSYYAFTQTSQSKTSDGKPIDIPAAHESL